MRKTIYSKSSLMLQTAVTHIIH